MTAARAAVCPMFRKSQTKKFPQIFRVISRVCSACLPRLFACIPEVGTAHLTAKSAPTDASVGGTNCEQHPGGLMLDKLKAWGQAAYNDIEATLGSDSAEQERLQNMRKKLDDGATTTTLNLNDVKGVMRQNRRGFAHWFLKPKNGEVAREEVYNDVLQKLKGARSVGTLLEYEKSWTEMTLRNTGSHEAWAMGGIDPGSSGTIDKKLIEQRLGMLGDLVAARTEDDISGEDHNSGEDNNTCGDEHSYREPDPMGIGCDQPVIRALPCYESNAGDNWEPCSRLEGAQGAFDNDEDMDLDQLFETGRHQIPWTRIDDVVESMDLAVNQTMAAIEQAVSSATFDAERDTVEIEAPAVLPAVQLRAVQDDEPEEKAHPYSNHTVHWIFEFSGPADADINRGKHRIKRVVGF